MVTVLITQKTKKIASKKELLVYIYEPPNKKIKSRLIFPAVL
jgi:hypothetical protein